MKKILLMSAMAAVCIGSVVLYSCNKNKIQDDQFNSSSNSKVANGNMANKSKITIPNLGDFKYVSIELSESKYDSIKLNPGSPILLDEVNADMYRVSNSTYPIVAQGNGCVEQMTSILRSTLQSQANNCCCQVSICLQGSNCAWYLYVFKPMSVRCLSYTWMPFTNYIQAYKFN
jgi:hypothetical protein